MSEVTAGKPPPAKRKKKRRGPKGDAGGRDPSRAGWPSFALAFPPDRELSDLVEAFEAGDHARVRAFVNAVRGADTEKGGHR